MIKINNQIINIDCMKYMQYDEHNETLIVFFTDDTYSTFIHFDEDDYDDLITELEERDLL